MSSLPVMEAEASVTTAPDPRKRIAVVSPFVDRRHGTERCLAEHLARLADRFELHLYSQRVEDVDLQRVTWHRVAALPGPHLLGYLWWFAANQLQRWWDRRVHGLRYDLVFSPGINCLDADACSVHVVFAELRRSLRHGSRPGRRPLSSWPRLLHQRLYYALIASLERRVYSGSIPLAPVSRKTAAALAAIYGRADALVQIVPNGVDPERFHPAGRERLRAAARRALDLPADAFAVLLIGNSWTSKGLPCLLEAVALACRPELRVLVVGNDNRAPFMEQAERLGLRGRILFLPPRQDVGVYYAAADAYVSPSLEDAFPLPPIEAMACGLPTVVSSRAGGVTDLLTQGVDGFVLADPTDAAEAAALLERLAGDPGLCRRVGEAGVATARGLTWERSAERMGEFLASALQRKRLPHAARPAVEERRV